MGDHPFSRVVDQVTGDGWLLSDSAVIDQVSYVIEIHDVWTWHDGRTFSGLDVTVRLRDHSIDPYRWKDQRLTLVLWDDLRISGFIRSDGTQFVRTGAPESPSSATRQQDRGVMSDRRAKRGLWVS